MCRLFSFANANLANPSPVDQSADEEKPNSIQVLSGGKVLVERFSPK
jgi:hypothetical protein